MMLAKKQATGLPRQGLDLPSVHQSSLHQRVVLHQNRLRCRRIRAQAVPTSVASDMMSWISTQGVDMDRTGVQVGPSGGLVASRPVAKGETAASIPESLWITKATAETSPLGPFLADLSPWLAVALFLIRERSFPNSEWRAYIDTLPTEVTSPVGWTDNDLEELRGTQLLSSIEGYRAFFQQEYQNLKENVFAANPEIFPSNLFTWDAFLWAACTVRARSHSPLDGEDVALVPLADLTQHARGGAVSITWAVKNAGLFGRGRVLAIEADRALAPGEPVAMDYGPSRTEGQILLDYGVTDVSTADGSFALTITLPEEDRFFDDKIDILELNGLQQANEFVIRAAGGAPEALLPTLRLVNIQGGDAFLLEAIFRNEVWEHMQQPVSEENEDAVCRSIVDGCITVLGAYPTTIEQDLAALGAAAPGSRAAAAAAVRLGEKEALEATLKLFESRLEKLKDLEYYGERRLKRLGLLDKEGKPTDWDSFFEDGIA
jgi:[ribulose-bisphosphate carboxylase]-lysine N-methyltransferase